MKAPQRYSGHVPVDLLIHAPAGDTFRSTTTVAMWVGVGASEVARARARTHTHTLTHSQKGDR